MPHSDDLKSIKTEEERILQETEKIEQAEERIKLEEKQILEAERNVLATVKHHPLKTFVRHGLNRRELSFLRTSYVRRLARHRFIFAILVLFAVILVWRGFWETS